MDNGIAVVTGSSGGIGGAVARHLAGMGFKLVLHCHSHMDAAEELCRELAGTGAQARVFQADLSSFSQAEALMEYAVREFGRIDCLVNNAGVTRDGLVMAMSEEDFGRVIDVNLKSCFNCIRHASRHMLRARTGSIVNIASVIGITGNAGQANYAASKAGIIGLTKSCAREFARRGVRVNAVAPGFIETEMTASWTTGCAATFWRESRWAGSAFQGTGRAPWGFFAPRRLPISRGRCWSSTEGW